MGIRIDTTSTASSDMRTMEHSAITLTKGCDWHEKIKSAPREFPNTMLANQESVLHWPEIVLWFVAQGDNLVPVIKQHMYLPRVGAHQGYSRELIQCMTNRKARKMPSANSILSV